MLSLLLRYFYNSSHCCCHCSVVVVIVGSVTIAVLVSFIVFVFVESKRPGGLSPGGDTPIYWLFGRVSLERVWFSSHLLWDKA